MTVAPPVKRVPIDLGAPPGCPWLIVQGDQDDLVDCREVVEWARSFAPPPRIEVIAGAEHFFHGRLADLRGRVSEFLSSAGMTAAPAAGRGV